jgi:hypothetical protein
VIYRRTTEEGRRSTKPISSRPARLDTQYQKLLALLVIHVGVALRLQRNNGVVRSANGPGQYMLWEVER